MKISSKVDLSLNVFVVTCEDEHGNCRPYHFNLPADASQRGAQVFECCVGEALVRHEAWVSGNYHPIAESPDSSSALLTPTVVENTTQPVASPVAKKRPAAAAEPSDPAATSPSVGAAPAAKKKPAAAAAAAAPTPVEVKFQKGDYCKKLFGAILTEKLGTGWTKIADYAADAKLIAKVLEDEGIVCTIDGVVTDEFKARVIAELEERYDFS